MYKGHSLVMTRLNCLLLSMAFLGFAHGQGKGDAGLRARADALFTEQKFNEALPLYAQLVSLTPADHDLNYRLGTCVVHSGDDKESAVGFLKFAVQNANTSPLAWYYLGRAYHLTYRFKEALDAYQHFRGTEDKRTLATNPVDQLEKQCRNGLQLLSNLKEVGVQSKVEVGEPDFFRYYDLTGIGGRIVVTPDELMSSLDRKSRERSVIYLPERGGRIYFSSYGKDGRTGRDIYTTSLLPDGTFEEPRKLAGYVNTDQDESFAAMAPDGRTLYFASKGHNSMGGYDVFKCTYDQGNDVYGPPVNMDFAVNTPSDDIFYMVDGEGKLACFASGRDSEQGMLHVYRVSTTQQPVIITVLKGTFANGLDPADRDAHITVEDAVTHERVADVKSDINGEYILSLPRNGRYKFSVVAGRSGRTHVGNVDVPRSDAPRAYRQELSLVNDGGEKLVIRNYFDEPLPDDLIALALDEIKRRAKLDVNDVRPVAQDTEPAAPTGDVLTQAGFTGDVTREGAQRLAADDAKEQAAEADELEAMSGAAYGETVEALAEADRATRAAQELIVQAGATDDEAAKNELMMEAAEERQRSRLAALQARAAYRSGNDLRAKQDSADRSAIAAAALNDRLKNTLGTGNDEAALSALHELKARMDDKNRPDASIAPDEAARRNAVAKEREAAQAMADANAKRDEENQLTDQVNRLKRERDAAKGGKKDQLAKQVTEYEGYRDAMHQEVEQAFARAKALEGETALARAQASLTRHLSTSTSTATATELDPGQIAALEEKLAVADRTIANLPIDERYDAMVAVQGTSLAQRTEFQWDLADAKAGTGDVAATETVDRDAAPGVQRADARNTAIDRTGSSGDLAQAGAAPNVGISQDAPGTEQRMAGANGGQDTRPDMVAAGDVTGTQVAANDTEERDGTATGTMNAGGAGAQDAVQQRTTTADVAARETPPTDVLPLTPDAARNGADDLVSAAGAVPAPERTPFLVENELAESRQLRTAARTRTQRDSLDARIAALEQELAEQRNDGTATAVNGPTRASSTDAMPSGDAQGGDLPVVPAIDFDRNATEAAIIADLFADYEGDKSRIASMERATERELSSNGLELMLVDSINAQVQAQLKELEKDASLSTAILPRVDRLRQMKEAHQRMADDAAMAARALPVAERSAGDEALASTHGTAPAANDVTAEEVAERYVAIEPQSEYIYESKLETRSMESVEAVAEHQGDVVRIIDLEDRIDSLEDLLGNMAQGREYDKLRERTDRLIDDRMILRMEMGQRSAYISKQEWKAGQDSLKEVRTEVLKLGLAPSEPLLVMAQRMEADARVDFDKAQGLRRRADNSEDIVLRDSLYRNAYATELAALRDIDRAITVSNYVLSADFRRGESPTYAMIEAELFNLATAPANTDRDGGTIATTDAPANGAATDGSSPAGDGTGIRDGATSTERTDTGSGSNAPEATVATAQDPAAIRARQLYQASLATDPLTATLIPLDDDPALLAQHMQRTNTASADLQQRSLQEADRASELRDSALTVNKRDREVLEAMARRVQLQADTLHMASLAMADSSALYAERLRAAEEVRRFDERLRKYYYLGAEEQALVLNEHDHSRYFMVRSKALEQDELAAEANQQATSARALANDLLKETQALMAPADGSSPSEADRAKASLLNDRVVALNARADSMDRAAARFAQAADLSERQASVILERMDPVRSSEIMALEQGTRRTEPFLAQAHSIAGEGMVDFEGMQRDMARTAGASQALAQAATTPANDHPAAGQGTSTPVASTAAPIVTTPDVNTQESGSTGVQATAEPAPGTGSTRSATDATMGAAPRGSPLADLASAYIAPEVLTMDVFELRETGERVSAAIAIDAPKPTGIVYSVQVGAFRKPIPADLFGDMIPVMGERAGNGLTRYTVGLFDDFAAANAAKNMVRERGYRDAFVVAYKDGRRVSLAQARSGEEAPPVLATARPVDATPIGTTVTISPAATVAPVVVAAADTGALAKYPASAEAIIDAFKPAPEAASYYNDPAAAPARQVETVKGLFFTVQVGVYSKPVPLDRLFNITPLNSERTETAKIRYTTGVYLDMERARTRKDEAVALGVKDAFVTAYLNGKRIPMTEARALIAKHGSSILADPSIETR